MGGDLYGGSLRRWARGIRAERDPELLSGGRGRGPLGDRLNRVVTDAEHLRGPQGVDELLGPERIDPRDHESDHGDTAGQRREDHCVAGLEPELSLVAG